MSETNSKQAKHAGGRPAIENVRSEFIAIRVTAIEKVKFLEKAHRSGVDPTEYARSRILRGIARKKMQATNDDVNGDGQFAAALRTAWHELRKIGVNLNQIARHCNRHQVPPPAELHELIAALLTIMRRLLAS